MSLRVCGVARCLSFLPFPSLPLFCFPSSPKSKLGFYHKVHSPGILLLIYAISRFGLFLPFSSFSPALSPVQLRLGETENEIARARLSLGSILFALPLPPP